MNPTTNESPTPRSSAVPRPVNHGARRAAMSVRVFAAALAGAVASLGAGVAFAQATPPAAPPAAANPATPSPPAPGSTGVDRGMGTGASAKPGSSASLAKSDGNFVRDAGASNQAEIALGKLAASHAASPAVKDFGNKMVADHTKAYDELTQTAKGKGVVVPTEPTAAQKRTAARLEKLSGAAFDKDFATVMVEDHKKAVSLFQHEATNGRDPDLKAWAAKTLPTLQEHLQMAEHLRADLRKK